MRPGSGICVGNISEVTNVTEQGDKVSQFQDYFSESWIPAILRWELIGNNVSVGTLLVLQYCSGMGVLPQDSGRNIHVFVCMYSACQWIKSCNTQLNIMIVQQMYSFDLSLFPR